MDKMISNILIDLKTSSSINNNHEQIVPILIILIIIRITLRC